ncbi:MAG TPA: hypothetical protein VH912_07565 [Streptosporangiaceae bacterium]|jgi:hypothetical protein
MQQLPRIIIAAVFFVIAALIAYPMINRSNTKSQASSAPTSASPSVTATATATKSGTAPTKTPTKTPTATATKTTTKTPTPTATPAVPLTASIGGVQCPARSVTVKVNNVSNTKQNYTIEQDGSPVVSDQLGSGSSRTSKLSLKEDDSTKVAVVWNDRTLKSTTRTANCTHAAPPPENLPHTGPSTAVTFARVATAVGALITGAIILWYGGLWPRRREQVLRAKR